MGVSTLAAMPGWGVDTRDAVREASSIPYPPTGNRKSSIVNSRGMRVSKRGLSPATPGFSLARGATWGFTALCRCRVEGGWAGR